MDVEEVSLAFREYLRQGVREALMNLMEEEVEQLCGRSHARGRREFCRRAGSEPGVFYNAGGKEGMVRPRVRSCPKGGKEKEVRLCSYVQARSRKNIEGEIFARMCEGVSSRGCSRMSRQTISASTASRMWVEGSLGKLEALRGRELSDQKYVALMVDGVYLARDLVVVVALGITVTGEKRILDFGVGSSESYEVVRDLLRRIVGRAFSPEGRLLAVLDGSSALRKGVKEFWPDSVIQACLIHKERNLHGYLRMSDHGECSRLMKRLRDAQGALAGREALDALKSFLLPRSAVALASLEEAGDDWIGLHLLEVPATLNVAFLSTNSLENTMLNYRRQTRRVTRWRRETNQVERWTGAALLWVEQGFHNIKGHADLQHLRAALAR